MRTLSLLFITILCYCNLAGAFSPQADILKMSTTTSTQASGLLDILLPEFTKSTGIKVKVIAKGTGAAIRDGMDGNVDIIFVHARSREEEFIREGYGTKRYGVMHNDFIILGPVEDPAGIRGCVSAALALKMIASTQSLFVSRGDDSGTHSKEQYLWEVTGLPLSQTTKSIVKKGQKRNVTFGHPQEVGTWYFSIGQGMGKALTFADEKQAYILADRGTFIKYKYGRDLPIDLEILCEGDPELTNPYGIIPVSRAKHPHVQQELAEQFAKWLISPEAQRMINGYRFLNKQLFYPDAIK